jgi:hypothetical protein
MDVVTQFLHPEGEPLLASNGDRLWAAWADFVYELDPLTLDMLAPAPQQFPHPVTAMAATADGLVTAHADGTIVSSSGMSVDLTADAVSGADIVTLLVDA